MQRWNLQHWQNWIYQYLFWWIYFFDCTLLRNGQNCGIFSVSVIAPLLAKSSTLLELNLKVFSHVLWFKVEQQTLIVFILAKLFCWWPECDIPVTSCKSHEFGCFSKISFTLLLYIALLIILQGYLLDFRRIGANFTNHRNRSPLESSQSSSASSSFFPSHSHSFPNRMPSSTTQASLSSEWCRPFQETIHCFMWC